MGAGSNHEQHFRQMTSSAPRRADLIGGITAALGTAGVTTTPKPAPARTTNRARLPRGPGDLLGIGHRWWWVGERPPPQASVPVLPEASQNPKRVRDPLPRQRPFGCH